MSSGATERIGARKDQLLNREWKKLASKLSRLAAYAGIFSGLLFIYSNYDHMRDHNFQLSRPAKIDNDQYLYQGVRHIQELRDSPRNLIIHKLKVDISQVEFLVSPPAKGFGGYQSANTATRFLNEHGLQLVVNANFFEGFNANLLPIFAFPQLGDLVDPLGLVISNGEMISEDQAGYPALCFIEDKATIIGVNCPRETENAIAGNDWLIQDGKISNNLDGVTLHPRVAAGISPDGKSVWLVVIDGRQPGYSEGVTLAELALIMFELGVKDAIVLDGGGSATAVTERGKINSPIQNNLFFQERAVSTLLGVYADEYR